MYIFITEGGQKQGWGHFSRSTSLANILKKFGPVIFFTSSNQLFKNNISRMGFNVKCFDNLNLMIKEVLKNNPTVVIIDKPDVEKKLVKAIKKRGCSRIIVFGSRSAPVKYIDVVVNSLLGFNRDNVNFYDSHTKTRYYIGPKYIIFKKDLNLYKGSYQYRNKLKKIMLSFGGSDPTNLTCKLLKKLVAINEEMEIKILLGQSYKFLEELNQIKRKNKFGASKINIFSEVKKISKLMLKVDFLLTSVGMTMFESLYLNIPTTAFVRNNKEGSNFLNFFIVRELNKVENIWLEMKETYNNYSNYKKKIKKLEIGEGESDIVKEILGDK